MLAVQPMMAALRRSNSNRSDHPSILRQPSAEDLDAAHQLVSSARGERLSPPTAGNERHPSIAHSPSPGPADPAAHAQIQHDHAPRHSEASGMEVMEREPAGFSQMCRYVFRCPLIMIRDPPMLLEGSWPGTRC
jgi:hypothetical protein